MAMSRQGATSSDLLLNPESMNNKLHQVLSNALVFFYRKEHTHCTTEKLLKLKKKNPKPQMLIYSFSCTALMAAADQLSPPAEAPNCGV